MRSGEVKREGERITATCASQAVDRPTIDVRTRGGRLDQLEFQTSNDGNAGPWVFVQEEQVRELLQTLLEVLGDG